jgi:hypothetical protein
MEVLLNKKKEWDVLIIEINIKKAGSIKQKIIESLIKHGVEGVIDLVDFKITSIESGLFSARATIIVAFNII